MLFKNISYVKLATYVTVVSSVALVVILSFEDYIITYFNLLFVEEYSYLIVAIPLTLAVFAKMLTEYFDIVGLNILRVISSLMFASISIVVYTLADVSPEYYIELKTLSLIFLLWAFISLVFKPRSSVAGISAMLLLLILIPIPRSFFDAISALLTSTIAGLVASTTGAKISVANGITSLIVRDSAGVLRSFSISPECSGIVSIASVLASSPLIFYLAGTSSAKLGRKIVAVVSALFASFLIVFIGNFLRLVSIVLATKNLGYNVAMSVFHYTPSLIYVALASATSIYLCYKISYVSAEAKVKRVSKPKLTIALVLSLIALVATAVFYSVVAPLNTHSLMLPSAKMPPESFEKLLKKPVEEIFSNSPAEIVSNIPKPVLGRALGVPNIRYFVVNYRGYVFRGYVELAEVPSRFHGWYVCLTFQGYRIEKSWSSIGNTTVNFLLLSTAGSKMLLGYSIYKYGFEEAKTPVYVRVSLFAPVTYGNYEHVSSAMRSLLNSIGAVSVAEQKQLDISTYTMLLANASVALGITLVALALIGKHAVKILALIKRGKTGTA